MALAQGYVQQLSWWWSGSSGGWACLWIGPDPATVELLTIASSASDSDVDRIAKRTMAQVLVQALVSGRQVDASHPDNSAEIFAASLPSDSHPLQMDALEVTQAVQDLGHSVPLVADKRTVARAYLSFYGSAPVTVTGQLSVRSTPSAPPVVIASANTVTLNPADAGELTLTRNDAARSLNFVLLPTATAAGQRTLWLSSVTDTATGNPIALGGARRPTVTFHDSPPLRVRVCAFSYLMGTPPEGHAPRSLDIALLRSWLLRAYPIGQIDLTMIVPIAQATPPFTAADINAEIAAIRATDVNGGTDARTHYYGLVRDTGFWMRGSAVTPLPVTSPDPSNVACGPTGVPGATTSTTAFTWDVDGSYGDWYGGHELAHTLGRQHPGFCGESNEDFNNYPFPSGQLSTTDAGFAGFDVGDPVNGLPLVALPGTQWRDIMTYCARQWPSAYTYEGIRARLLAEDALPAKAGAGAGPWQRGASYVSVVATVNLTQRQGRIAFVNPVPNVAPTNAVPDSSVVLRLATKDGMTICEHPVPVKLDCELGPDDDQIGLVDAVVTAELEATVIELLIGGEVVDIFRAGGAPPVVQGVRAVPVDRHRARIAVDLDRPAEDDHTFSVQVSTDRGRTWQTLGVGLKEPSLAVDPSQFTSEQELLLRVIVTNGFVSSVGTSEVFRSE